MYIQYHSNLLETIVRIRFLRKREKIKSFICFGLIIAFFHIQCLISYIMRHLVNTSLNQAKAGYRVWCSEAFYLHIRNLFPCRV